MPRWIVKVVVALILYAAAWKVTSHWGPQPGTHQWSPAPFVLVDDSRPNYVMGKNGAPLTMEFDQQYFTWFFGKPRFLAKTSVRRRYFGLTRRQQKLLMKANAIERRGRQVQMGR